MAVTLRTELSTKDNALNFVRLALAATVVIAHAWLAGGFQGGEQTARFSAWAVNGFFALSGYLIAGSRMRSGFREFILSRAFRIFPAFFVVLTVVAFAVAPLTAKFAGWDYSISSATSYLYSNFLLVIRQPGIDSTLVDVPWPEVWNLSLWTLAYEFAAYIAAALILTVSWVRRNPTWVIGLAYGLTVLLQWAALAPSRAFLWPYFDLLRLMPWFLAGMLIFFVSDRLHLRWWHAVTAAIILAVTFWLGVADLIGHLPFAIVLLWAGARLSIRLGSRNDISYGLYIWAWPIQQILATAETGWMGPLGSGALALALTIPVAWVSWRFVERPALRFRKKIPLRFYRRLSEKRRAK